MSILAIIIIVFAVVVAVLAFLGYRVMRKRQAETAGTFEKRLVEANEALADARAEDRGWDMTALQEAARAAVDRRSPDANVRGVHLVQVIDRPGTDDDEARFHVDVAMGRDFEITLYRTGDTWSELHTRQ